MFRKYLKKNAQTLNINTILYSNPHKNHSYVNKNMANYNIVNRFDNGSGNERGDKNDLMSMNNVINTKISPKYKIIKYLGEGIQGSLYLAIDKENNRYICKKMLYELYERVCMCVLVYTLHL